MESLMAPYIPIPIIVQYNKQDTQPEAKNAKEGRIKIQRKISYSHFSQILSTISSNE
jgi:hypothetical protein